MPLINRRYFVRGLGLTLVALAMAMVGGCITPPAIPAAGWDDLDLLDYPPGAERVELTVDDDRTSDVTWPAGVPVATSIWYQYGIQDDTASGGASLSNAVVSTQP